MNLYYHDVQSPVGTLRLVADDSALVAILWEHDTAHQAQFASAVRSPDHPILRDAQKQLAEYFAGSRTRFSVPLRAEGTTFQRRVWRQLCQIPFGTCYSYSQLAQAIGHPTAARAVGAATGRNPLSIMVPCHRLIGRDGKLTGFAGGLKAKAHLIALERRIAKGNDHANQPAADSSPAADGRDWPPCATPVAALRIPIDQPLRA